MSLVHTCSYLVGGKEGTRAGKSSQQLPQESWARGRRIGLQVPCTGCNWVSSKVFQTLLADFAHQYTCPVRNQRLESTRPTPTEFAVLILQELSRPFPLLTQGHKIKYYVRQPLQESGGHPTCSGTPGSTTVFKRLHTIFE